MTHNLAFLEETQTDAVFQCANCGAVIGFNKEGVGEPHAQLVGGVWIPPATADEYLGECA